jgi:hypothetical protein
MPRIPVLELAIRLEHLSRYDADAQQSDHRRVLLWNKELHHHWRDNEASEDDLLQVQLVDGILVIEVNQVAQDHDVLGVSIAVDTHLKELLLQKDKLMLAKFEFLGHSHLLEAVRIQEASNDLLIADRIERDVTEFDLLVT